MTHPRYFDQMFKLGINSLAGIVEQTDEPVLPTAVMWSESRGEAKLEHLHFDVLAPPTSAEDLAIIHEAYGTPDIMVLFGEYAAPLEDEHGMPLGVGPVGFVYARASADEQRLVTFRLDRSQRGLNRVQPYGVVLDAAIVQWTANVMEPA